MRSAAASFLALAVFGCAGPGAQKVSPTARLFAQPEHFAAQQLFESHLPKVGRDSVFSIDWRRPLTSPEFLEWKPREFSRPAVDDSGRVYVASRDGYVRAFDETGVPLWEHAVKGPFFGGLSTDGDRVYVATGDGQVLALATEDGTQRWSYRAGEELGSRPVVANGMVFVASFADSIYALDAETGAWKWQYRRDTAAEFTIRGVGTPAVDFDKLFIGFSDGTAMALDTNDGTVKWQRQLSTAHQFPDVDADPQLDGSGHVVFASYAGGLFSLDEETGANLWAAATPGTTTLLIHDAKLYVGSANSIDAYAADTGAHLWKLPLPEGFAGKPVMVAKYLIVPTTSALVFVDRDTGQPRRVFDPGLGISAPPAVSRNALYVVSNYGYLYALVLARPRG